MLSWPHFVGQQLAELATSMQGAAACRPLQQPQHASAAMMLDPVQLTHVGAYAIQPMMWGPN